MAPSSRSRASSDPFNDPQHRPPPPPPKQQSPRRQSSQIPAAAPKSAPATNHDITDAVRDTVIVRGSTDYNPRSKMSRSQTATPPQSSRPSGRRSHSQDSANIIEVPRPSAKSRAKKGSQHADVIDRLDFTGVGPMFHHDGPFDACAPSRNKHRSKAPMYAWTTPHDAPDPQAYGDSAYPSSEAYKAFSNDYRDPPKKKVDAIAEAWGIHEPEPYEEFFAGGGSTRPDGDTPASSIYNGKDSHQSHSTSRSAPRPARSRQDEGRPRGPARRSLVPPPQPIFVPDPTETVEPSAGYSPPSGTGFPKRSKSLMQRIRKMRDAPNVPVGPNDYESSPPSPSSPTENASPQRATRPTHRSQNSFLGRFAGAGSRAPQTAPAEKQESYVFIEPYNNKDLPVPPSPSQNAPQTAQDTGYFDGSPQAAAAASPGLGRKQSLMKKVGRVVRGTR